EALVARGVDESGGTGEQRPQGRFVDVAGPLDRRRVGNLHGREVAVGEADEHEVVVAAAHRQQVGEGGGAGVLAGIGPPDHQQVRAVAAEGGDGGVGRRGEVVVDGGPHDVDPVGGDPPVDELAGHL